MVFFPILTVPSSKVSVTVIKPDSIAQTAPEFDNQSKGVSRLDNHPIAQLAVDPEGGFSDEMSTFTDVNELSNIDPDHWAWEALRSLKDKYQCLPEVPKLASQAPQTMSRDAFAQAVSQCLDAIALYPFSQVEPEDWAQVQRLQSDFLQEISSLKQRIDRLDHQVSTISQNQFSPTTRVTGDAVFSLEQLGGENRPSSNLGDLPEQLAVGSRLRLNLDTSFTGQDLLRVRLDALNPVVYNVKTTGTNMTRLNFDRSNNNNFDLGQLFYRFPLSQSVKLQVDAAQGSFYASSLDTFNGSFANPVSGSVSRFGRFNPIYYQGFPGSGATATYQPNPALSLSLGYLAKESDASQGATGLFNSSNTVMTQLAYQVSPAIQLGLTYAHSHYNKDGLAVAGGTGSQLANAPFGNLETSANHFGLESTARLGSRANLSGWAGLSIAEAKASGGGIESGDQATLFNWAIALGLPDLGGKGHYGGLILGQPPHLLSHSDPGKNEDAALHIEVLYRYQVSPQVSIIPGVFVLLHPENQVNNDPIWVGSLRTTLRF